jgi:hypothetical protein
MRKIVFYSAFKIIDEKNLGINPNEYSMFKYGSKDVARKFGYALADNFFYEFSKELKEKKLVVIPSAYSHIQTASCSMASFFVDRLNLFLFQNGCSSVEQSKICRTVTYREDYGEMSAEERFNMIKGDIFHIDKSFLENKILIFLDDIKITGTHERIIIKMLDNFDIQNDCFILYYANLNNSGINPRIENFLNHHFVKNLNDLDTIIKTDSFIFNTRVVKYILNSSKADCANFLRKQSFEFILELFFLAIGNNYAQFEEYQENILYIKKLVSSDEYIDYNQNCISSNYPQQISI